MPNFKPKSKKKIKMNENSTITLDNKHNEKMDTFYEIDTKILPNLKREKKKLKNKYKKEVDLEKKLEIKNKLREIKDEIKNLKTKKNDYLLKNLNLIFDYFEKKKDSIVGNNKSRVLHSFFKKKNEKDITQDVKEEKNNIHKYLININEYKLDINNYLINYELCKKCGGELIQVKIKE